MGQKKDNLSAVDGNGPHPILNIRIYPDQILKNKAVPIEEISDNHRRLTASMVETMYAASGVGLAAPQVGISQRLIVVHLPIDKDDNKRNPLALINPCIIQKTGEIVEEEGCLSVPDVKADIRRYSCVTVTYRNIHGKQKQIEGSGLVARIIQHEIDHLDGILFIDYLGRIRRDLLKRKFRKKSPPPLTSAPDSEFLQALTKG